MRALSILAIFGLSHMAFATPLIVPKSMDAVTRLNALQKVATANSALVGPKKITTAYRPIAPSIFVPPNLGRTPSISDIRVDSGIDGKTPAEALAIVRSKLSTKVVGNDAFIDKMILGTHKTFTLAVNNVKFSTSPIAKLLAGPLKGADVTILGLLSAEHPAGIMAKGPKDKVASFYVLNDTGGYDHVDKLAYRVLMKANLQPGVANARVSYTSWSASVLAQKLTTITEQ